MNAHNPRLVPYEVQYDYYQNGLIIHSQWFKKMKPIFEGQEIAEVTSIKEVDFEHFARLCHGYDFKETKHGRKCRSRLFGIRWLYENDRFSVKKTEKPYENFRLKDLLDFPVDQVLCYIKENLPILEETECQKE